MPFSAADVGLWLVEPLWFCRAMAAYKAHIEAGRPLTQAPIALTPTPSHSAIAVIPIRGPLVKEHSFFSWFFGGTSQEDIQHAVGKAVADPQIRGILQYIDSPGGQVAGTDASAEVLRQAADKKPVWTHYADLGASAALWLGSQSSRASAEPVTEVGSAGTMAVLTDSSKMAEEMGITVYVEASGPLKAFGVPGTPLSDEGKIHLRERIQAINGHFMEALRQGRGMSEAQITEVRRGGLYIAEAAKQQGLIDEVTYFPQVLQAFAEDVRTRRIFAMRNPFVALARAFAQAAEDVESPEEPPAAPPEKTEQGTEKEAVATPGLLASSAPDPEALIRQGYDAAADIVTLCALAGLPEQAQSLLADHCTAAQARSRLQALKVAADQQIVSTHLPGEAGAQHHPRFTSADIYRLRAAAQQGKITLWQKGA